jgi:hypothetical protein
MISIKAQGFDTTARKLHKIARTELRRGIMDGIETGARVVETNLKGPSGTLSGSPVKVRSGRLRTSVRTHLDRTRLEGRVGTNVFYAVPLEDGATIRPIRAKKLAIPLRAALTARGKSRGTPREVGATYKSTFIRKSRSGNLILFGKRSNDKAVALFVLVDRVRLKPKRPFALAAQKAGVGVVNAMHQSVGRALDA